MQSILTIAAQSVALFTVGYTVIAFAVYAWNRSGSPRSIPAADPAPVSVEPPSPPPTALPDPWESPIAPVTAAMVATAPVAAPRLLLLPPAREIAPVAGKPRRRKASAPALPAVIPTTIRELRRYCTQQGIKGASRMTKAQCYAALYDANAS